MNPRLNVTQKTYYALGVLASVLNLAGSALYLAASTPRRCSTSRPFWPAP